MLFAREKLNRSSPTAFARRELLLARASAASSADTLRQQREERLLLLGPTTSYHHHNSLEHKLLVEQRVQVSMYVLSSRMTSIKLVIELRPLTCHKPVIPVFILMNTRCARSYFFHSATAGGRTPTRPMPPLRTLKNCRNSSKGVPAIR